jgi:EAL domain-containing protein (putative c-di-GMP-specific phosphodiesterase class I)
VALDDSGVVRRVVEQLRAEGLSIAIDDFGTGYSSLSALRDLPIDVVKLDRSFVSGLPFQPDSLAICRGVIAVAHEMGIVVVGEGVETDAQLDCLVELGCDRVQGYALHRPAPAAEVVAGLSTSPLSATG